jgi:hypothetical protein
MEGVVRGVRDTEEQETQVQAARAKTRRTRAGARGRGTMARLGAVGAGGIIDACVGDEGLGNDAADLAAGMEVGSTTQ